MSAIGPEQISSASVGPLNSAATNVAATPAWAGIIGSRCLVVLHTLIVDTLTVSSIDMTQAGVGATWQRVHRHAPGGAGVLGMEQWVGSGFSNSITGTNPTITITFSGSVTKRIIRASLLRMDTEQTTAPTILTDPASVNGAQGSSTVADPGAPITGFQPGDLVFSTFYNELNAAPTGYSDAGYVFSHRGSASNSTSPYAHRHELAWAQVQSNHTATTGFERVYSLSSSSFWITMMSGIRPVYETNARSEPVQLYKGRPLRSLDTVGAK